MPFPEFLRSSYSLTTAKPRSARHATFSRTGGVSGGAEAAVNNRKDGSGESDVLYGTFAMRKLTFSLGLDIQAEPEYGIRGLATVYRRLWVGVTAR